MKKHLRDLILIAAILLIGGIIALVFLLSRKAGRSLRCAWTGGSHDVILKNSMPVGNRL